VDSTGRVIGKHGFIMIPGGGATEEEAEVLARIPFVPERGEYPILRIWEDHDNFQSTLNLVQQINKLFLEQLGKLPDIMFEQNATIPISTEGHPDSVYATPMIKFRLDKYED